MKMVCCNCHLYTEGRYYGDRFYCYNCRPSCSDPLGIFQFMDGVNR